MLLARGADPDCQDKYGHAPIHRAASKGYEKMVQILLQVPKQLFFIWPYYIQKLRLIGNFLHPTCI